MARTSEDKKDCVIKVRVNDETKSYLDNMARSCSMNVSEYVRKIIGRDRSEQRRKELSRMKE